MRTYCVWCWGVHARPCSLCSGRACTLRQLRVDRSQKKAAKRRGLVAPVRVGRGQFAVQNICPLIWKEGFLFCPPGSFTECLSFFASVQTNTFILNCTNLICALDRCNQSTFFSYFLTQQRCFSAGTETNGLDVSLKTNNRRVNYLLFIIFYLRQHSVLFMHIHLHAIDSPLRYFVATLSHRISLKQSLIIYTRIYETIGQAWLKQFS